MPEHTSIRIPTELLPADGRFGSGPTKVRAETLASLADAGQTYMGTSHRRPTVRAMVGRVREGLTDLFGLPEGYEVVLGNGGATGFWDAATFGLIERRSQHLCFGEFSSKFARAVNGAPHLDAPELIEASPGTHPMPVPSDRIDLYGLTHNETSTGVTMPIKRVAGEGLTVVDATSAAGGTPVDPEELDVYYFSPQKAFGGDGGLFVALCSPRAIERIERIAASDRWIPPFLSLESAVSNSRKDQTYNTPALATIFMLADTVEWINSRGGLAWSAARCAENAAILYDWAESHPMAYPFVTDPSIRSRVNATIDFEQPVSGDYLAATLRANGVVDTESYRKLGRNQLRIGLWPTIPPTDVEALTACLDYVIEATSS
ncbi:MAG: phosphoserine transaminase [bacterium]|nr:phosphoserine transaminase [bacterium]MDE0289873.1 phosphoserine transaminase [bacterium]MDE0436823.1 phosphoserine transaminase [bacterium]